MKQLPKDTVKMAIKDFAKMIICEGHLFLTGREGRKFYLMKPGVFVDPAFVKKHAPQNTIFDYQPVANEEIKHQFIQLFKELRYLQYEKDLREKSFEIVKLFQSVHSNSESFLSFALACYEQFCALPVEDVLKLHETDMYLFRKSFYSAAFAVIIGIGNDFYNPLILKDFFNLTLALDIGLCDSNYSYYVSQACNNENQNPGTGKSWMKQEKATDSELKVFLDHPQKSYEYIKSANFLNHPELAEIALYQHELSTGQGFPRGVPKGLVSSWESVVLLADSLVEINDEFEFDNNVIEYVLNFQNSKMSELPVARVYKKFRQGLQYFKSLKETGT